MSERAEQEERTLCVQAWRNYSGELFERLEQLVDSIHKVNGQLARHRWGDEDWQTIKKIEEQLCLVQEQMVPGALRKAPFDDALSLVIEAARKQSTGSEKIAVQDSEGMWFSRFERFVALQLVSVLVRYFEEVGEARRIDWRVLLDGRHFSLILAHDGRNVESVATFDDAVKDRLYILELGVRHIIVLEGGLQQIAWERLAVKPAG